MKKRKKTQVSFLWGIRRHMWEQKGNRIHKSLEQTWIGSYKNPRFSSRFRKRLSSCVTLGKSQQNWNSALASRAGLDGRSWSPNLQHKTFLLNKYTSPCRFLNWVGTSFSYKIHYYCSIYWECDKLLQFKVGNHIHNSFSIFACN